MASSLLITLREGLEIALVLAIITAYLHRTNRSDRLRDVRVGAIAAGITCLVAGIAFHILVGSFEGKWEQAIEGTLALLAVGVLTWMIFWMRGNARGISTELHQRIDSSVDKSPMALMSIAFVAVGREGFETVIFLLGAETSSSSGSSVIIGGLIGLSIAAVLGWLLAISSDKVDIKKFFNWTGLLLILFAAGLFGKAVHEFRELFGFEGAWYSTPLWEITSGQFSEGSTLYDFMKGLFGWSDHPERIRGVAYLAYLIPTLMFYFRGAKPATPSKVGSATAESEMTTV